MEPYLLIKKKKLTQILELESEMFDLYAINKDKINFEACKIAESEIEKKINVIRNQRSFW